MRIDYEDLTLPVVKRKYTVPKNEFVAYMRSSRQASGLTIQEVAGIVGVNKTEADHWFRADSGFSVPRPDVWNDVKRALSLDSRYDEVVTEFIEVDGVYEKAGRCYWTDGISPTLTSAGAAELIFERGLNENKRKEDETLTNTQTSIFEFMSEEETVEKKPFKYISLFAGIGGFDFGLNEVGGECVFASEIDKFAKQAYTTLHGLEPHGDITKIDAKDIPDHDVIAAGFPCQSFSVAGKRGGFEDARGTLFFEVARIASEKQPKVLLLENVKGLVGHDKGKTLDTIVKTLNEIGYRVDFEVLNSKYFGVPQNRERIFIVAIREDLVANEPWNIEGSTVVPKGKRRISGYEDVKTFNFDWPTNDTVQLRLKDVLESEVDEKYYLSEEKTSKLTVNSDLSGNLNYFSHRLLNEVSSQDDIAPTLNTMQGGHREPKITTVINARDITHGNENVYSPEGLTPTITARDYKGAKLVAESLPDEVGQGVDLPAIGASGGRNIENPSDRTPGNDVEQRLELNNGGTSNTLTSVQKDNYVVEPLLRIRKLTPLECWRLQGFTDEQHNAVEASGISNSQRYKQAGNAVTVNVIEAIGTRLLPYL